MIQGKLYKCPDYYLLLYPTKEAVETAFDVLRTVGPCSDGVWSVGSTWSSAFTNSKFWTSWLDCTVHIIDPGEVFMCLEPSEGEYKHVLFREKQGWIFVKNWSRFKEL